MYNSLFQKINILLQKEKLQKDERFARGEYFNIFRVMHMESDEVYTHSALIAELLNPNGGHGCKDTFLQLFLQLLPFEIDCQFNTMRAITDTEVEIGRLSENEGGRMDLLVSSGRQAIIIENKIFAGDQYNQLLRYDNYAREHYGKGNYKLLYLTLNGKPPSDYSTGGNLKDNIDYYCISYVGEIRKWLLLCLEKTAQKPLVREILIQYLNLINDLTHQDMESNVKNELIELCSNPQNMEALLWISNNFPSVIQRVMESSFVPQLRSIETETGLKLHIKDDGNDWINTSWMSFSFKRDNWRTFEVCFEFQSKNMRNMVSGFRYHDGHRGTEANVYDALGKLNLNGGCRHSAGWPIYHNFLPEHKNWISEEIMTMIEDGTLKGLIQKELLSLVSQAEMLNAKL